MRGTVEAASRGIKGEGPGENPLGPAERTGGFAPFSLRRESPNRFPRLAQGINAAKMLRVEARSEKIRTMEVRNMYVLTDMPMIRVAESVAQKVHF